MHTQINPKGILFWPSHKYTSDTHYDKVTRGPASTIVGARVRNGCVVVPVRVARIETLSQLVLMFDVLIFKIVVLHKMLFKKNF